MPRPKKGSKLIEFAERRLSVFNTLDEDMDLGNGLTVKAYSEKIEKTRSSVADYNASLTVADQQEAECKVAEKELNQMTSDMLAAVKLVHGRKSQIYKLLSSVKKSLNPKKRSTAIEAAPQKPPQNESALPPAA